MVEKHPIPDDGPAQPEEGEEEPAETGRVPFSSSFTVERVFKVDGKRIIVQAVIPAAAARAIGMEATMEAARRMLIRVDSKEAHIEETPRGK